MSVSLDGAGAPRTISAPVAEKVSLTSERIWSIGKPF
jgi:hypothetical protein